MKFGVVPGIFEIGVRLYLQFEGAKWNLVLGNNTSEAIQIDYKLSDKSSDIIDTYFEWK